MDAASRWAPSAARSIIDRPPDDVWALIGDPATIAGWFPGMVDAQVDGTSRVITDRESGIPMPEEIVTNDPIQRRFQYRVAGADRCATTSAPSTCSISTTAAAS